jgi:hypothetical protein
MQTLYRGTTQPLTALFYASPNVPVDVTSLELTVTSLFDGSTALQVTTPFLHPATGTYVYTWDVPANQGIAQYLVVWTGLVGAESIEATETIQVITSTDASNAPCAPYPYTVLCEIPTGASVEVTGVALQAATDFLYLATAQRFEYCQVTLRPCRDECYPNTSGNLFFGYPQWWGSQWPYPMKIGANWVNLACGYCVDGCSCATISQVTLPGPVREIVQVLVDGEVLLPGVDYRLDNYRSLVRLGGAQWPACNNYNLADTEVGTWSVTAIYGEELPALGKIAMGQLFCVWLSGLLGEDCEIPANVIDLTRQGVTMSFNDINEVLELGLTGLSFVDRFITTYNPNKLQARPQIYDLDGPTHRAVGTA